MFRCVKSKYLSCACGGGGGGDGGGAVFGVTGEEHEPDDRPAGVPDEVRAGREDLLRPDPAEHHPGRGEGKKGRGSRRGWWP